MKKNCCPHVISEQKLQQEKVSNSKRVRSLTEKLRSVVYNDDVNEERKKIFVEVCHVISSILPKLSNPNVNGIDDLLYPNIDTSQVGPSSIAQYYLIPGEDWIRKVLDSWYNVYYSCRNNCEYCNHVIDTVCLQLIEKYPLEFVEHVEKCFIKLLETNGDVEIIQAMKILRLLFDKHNSSVFIECDLITKLWFIKLLKFNCVMPAKQYSPRIRNWISNQLPFFKDKISSYEWNDMDAILNIIKNGFDENSLHYWFISSCIKYEYKYDYEQYAKESREFWFCYFKSALDEAEKLERMKTFMRGLTEFYKKSSYNLVDEVLGRCEPSFSRMNKNNQLEEYFGDNIELLSEIDLLEHITNQQIIEKLRQLFVCDDVENKLNIFIKEHLSDFKDFNMDLNFLTEINTSFEICRKQGWLEINEILDTGIFCREFKSVELFTDIFIRDSSRRGKVPILLEILRKKCPIVFSKSKTEYMMEEFRKKLEMEADVYNVEGLYFAINATPTNGDNNNHGNE